MCKTVEPTPGPSPESDDFSCSFCGLSRDAVAFLITSKNNLCICERCVFFSLSIISEEAETKAKSIRTLLGTKAVVMPIRA